MRSLNIKDPEEPESDACIRLMKQIAAAGAQVHEGGSDRRRAVGVPHLHVSTSSHRHPPQVSAILAVQKFAHRFPPGLMHFGVQVFLGGAIFRFRFTTAWASVRETGLVRLQLEFF